MRACNSARVLVVVALLAGGTGAGEGGENASGVGFGIGTGVGVGCATTLRLRSGCCWVLARGADEKKAAQSRSRLVNLDTRF